MTVEGIAHFFGGGVYAKQMMLPKGHQALTHKHTYDHLSILAEGEVDIFLDGEPTRYKAPACIEIKAGITHGIVAHTNATFYCVHQTDETKFDGVMIEKVED